MLQDKYRLSPIVLFLNHKVIIKILKRLITLDRIGLRTWSSWHITIYSCWAVRVISLLIFLAYVNQQVSMLVNEYHSIKMEKVKQEYEDCALCALKCLNHWIDPFQIERIFFSIFYSWKKCLKFIGYLSLRVCT